MCDFRLILFSSRVTCSLLREACKSFPFNHGIQDSSQAVPRCLRFSITPAWNSTSPCKPESFFEPRKIFYLVLKLLLLLCCLGFLSPCRLFRLHIACLLGLSPPRLWFSSTGVLSSSIFLPWVLRDLVHLLPTPHPLLQFMLNLKSCFLVQRSIFFCI